ncbi:Serine/threonine-protein kinase pkn3 [Labilithrix luteola]|uniref:Serine/threonine-protein kinase pkn3 n=1 Tax=Labilithrix luteola TaxID=1391654 RepID=A0A0K1QG35_9BACT|nr:serine/threonine-protein kinase [Labilithrix luteola]AKV04632.1 Serine/threonine-protein kinase pkn3 [Labilithrix luteola]
MRGPDLEEIAQARVGQTLEGKWTLEALLGVGGMAAVFRAKHKNGNRVAIKILHERFHREKSIRQRFLREARIANQVDHPAVVRFYDDGTTDDGAPFLVTELLSGQNLEDAREAAGGMLPFDEVVRIGDLVLSVLEIAHASGVVHRDLKPANLFRANDGELFVLDFGLARAFEDEENAGSALTSADSLLGTVGFMAPEQAQGRWDLVGPGTDLFAVGATLLKLATGLDIHEGRTAQERIVLAATRPVAPTKSRAPAVPPELCNVLDRAMAFAPKDRFAHAREFRASLTGTAPTDPSIPTGQPARVSLPVSNAPNHVAVVSVAQTRPHPPYWAISLGALVLGSAVAWAALTRFAPGSGATPARVEASQAPLPPSVAPTAPIASVAVSAPVPLPVVEPVASATTSATPPVVPKTASKDVAKDPAGKAASTAPKPSATNKPSAAADPLDRRH